MVGDATLFARQDVVEAAWAIVDPVLDVSMAPAMYDCGTWGPTEANQLVEDIGDWMPTSAADAALITR
jgi:glucose-6-phosphate 1-dehydrogenase